MINIQEKIENIFKTTCGTWKNCNKSTVLSFLSQCQEQSIDPQFCLNWLEQYKEQISHWSDFSKVARAWVNEQTSTGSPITMHKQED